MYPKRNERNKNEIKTEEKNAIMFIAVIYLFVVVVVKKDNTVHQLDASCKVIVGVLGWIFLVNNNIH